MKHILLVEDNLINQDVARGILGALGCQVDVVANGREALAQLENQHYDLIFMDCQMPVLDGYQTTRQIRMQEQERQQPLVPIIALTAHALMGDRERCLACGMNDYLAKPVRVVDLQRVLTQWLPIGEDNRTQVTEIGFSKGESTMQKIQVTTHENALDAAKVNEVQKIMGDRFALVVERFAQNGEKLCATFAPSFVAKDWDALKATIHTLKGSSGNLGAVGVYDLCLKIEKLLAHDEYSKVTLPLLQQLDAAFLLAVSQLRQVS